MSQPPPSSSQQPPTSMAPALRNAPYTSSYQLFEHFIPHPRNNIPFSDNPPDLPIYPHQQQHQQQPHQQQLLYHHPPDLRQTPIQWSQHDPITSQPPPPPQPQPQPTFQPSQPLQPGPSMYQHQQLPSKRRRPSSSQAGPSDKRVGKDRVERPCSKCGTMNHIRKNKCSNCDAPKDPPKKRTRRRRRAFTSQPQQLPPQNPSQPTDPLFDPSNLNPYVSHFDPHDVTTTTSSSRH